jgi:hypothetical protein
MMVDFARSTSSVLGGRLTTSLSVASSAVRALSRELSFLTCAVASRTPGSLSR